MKQLILSGLFLAGAFHGTTENVKTTKLNFSEHIAPIIFNNCTTCHRQV
jgi:hypothetical protein